MEIQQENSSKSAVKPKILDGEQLSLATKQLIESYIDEQIEYVIRPLKNTIKNWSNTIDLHQQSFDLSLKQINMRINAIVGSEKRIRKEEQPLMTFSNLEEFETWKKLQMERIENATPKAT